MEAKTREIKVLFFSVPSMDKKPKNYRTKYDLSGFRLLVGMETGRSRNNACRAAWRVSRARSMTAGNTLLMLIASNLKIKMAVPG